MTDRASESAVLAAVQLRAAVQGDRLFRNNSGELKRTEPTVVTQAMVGRTFDVAMPGTPPTRFGLGNISKEWNARLKSADLVGWRPTLITPDMVGHVLAVTLGVECKPEGWRLTPGDKRGQAQARWGAMLQADGGIFEFCTDPTVPEGL